MTEWFGPTMPPSRPPVLSDQNRKQALMFKKELQPWFRLIVEIHHYGARRTLDAEATEKEILRRYAAGEPLPRFPSLERHRFMVSTSIGLSGWSSEPSHGATAWMTPKASRPSFRRFYSPLGLPEYGSEPLRDLLRPLEKRRRRRKTAEGAAETSPPFTDKSAQRQRLPSGGDETLPLASANESTVPPARPRSHSSTVAASRGIPLNRLCLIERQPDVARDEELDLISRALSRMAPSKDQAR